MAVLGALACIAVVIGVVVERSPGGRPAPLTAIPATTVTESASTPAPTTTAPPVDYSLGPTTPIVVVTDFGAIADDDRDDSAALQRAIDAAPAGGTVAFPAGTYVQSELLRVRTAGVRLWSADDAVIHAVNPARQAIFLQGERTSLEGFTLTTTSERRTSSLEQSRVVLDRSAGSVVTKVHVNGSSGAGIFMYGASDYLIASNIVENTKGDGIHNTFGSTRGRVVDNIVRSVGDDCVSVVSYIPDAVVTTDITVEGNTCLDGQARAFTVVGGSRIRILNNRAERSRAAGIYLASELSYNTYAAKQIEVIGNTIVNANWDRAVDHASIFLFGRPGTWSGQTLQNEDILIKNNTSIDPIGGAAHIVSVDGYSHRVNVVGNVMTGSKSRAINLARLATDDYNIARNTLNGKDVANQIGNPAILPP